MEFIYCARNVNDIYAGREYSIVTFVFANVRGPIGILRNKFEAFPRGVENSGGAPTVFQVVKVLRFSASIPQFPSPPLKISRRIFDVYLISTPFPSFDSKFFNFFRLTYA